MGGFSDGLLMLIIAGIAVYFAYRGFVSWVRKPLTLRAGLNFEMNEVIKAHPAVDLLEQSGYEVISDKLKIPLAFKTEDKLLYSRMYIDYIAVRNGEFYIVKTARDRLNIEWTGSGLRRDILPYLLLYPDCAGVLYVDASQGEIKEILLIHGDEAEEQM